MSSPSLFDSRLAEAVEATQNMQRPEIVEATQAVADTLVTALRASRKVLLCGNGGSAADAQHLAAELVGRFIIERRALPALALADNVAAVTAIANDFAYEDVFARAVAGLGAEGDVLIGLSTSGRSQNVVRAFEEARRKKIICVAFINQIDCPLAAIADHVLAVRGPSTARIQECHMILGHIIFEMVEAALFA